MLFDALKYRIFASLFLLSFGIQTFASDSTYIDTLNSSAYKYQHFNTDTAIELSNIAFAMSKSINYDKGKFESLTCLCFTNYIKGNYTLAENYCNESIDIGAKLEDKGSLIKSYHYLGLLKSNQGKYDEALDYTTKMVKIAESIDAKEELADGYENMGTIYVNQKSYHSALYYLKKSLEVHEGIDHQIGKYFALMNTGRLQMELNELDSAKYFLEKAIDVGLQLNNERILVYTYSLLGQVHMKNLDFGNSEVFLLKGMNISDRKNLKWEKANIRAHLTELYYQTKNYDNAIRYGNEAIQLSNESNIAYIQQKVNNILAKIYLDMGDYLGAKIHVQNLKNLMDSIMQNDNNEDVAAIVDDNFIYEESRNLELVSNQLKTAKSQIELKNFLLVGSIVLSFLLLTIIVLIMRSNRIKSKSNTSLVKMNENILKHQNHLQAANLKLDSINKEKDMLLSIVAHDIRSPLSKISGLVNIIRLENGHNGQVEVFDKIDKTVTDANHLAGELLEVSKIESGAIGCENREIVLFEFA